MFNRIARIEEVFTFWRDHFLRRTGNLEERCDFLSREVFDLTMKNYELADRIEELEYQLSHLIER